MAAGVANAAPAATTRPVPRSTLTAQENTVVRAFLRTDRYLRLATRADCRCEGAIAARRSTARDYEPFAVAADFNGDGATDIAVLLFDSDPYTFAPGVLAIFNGPFHGVKPPDFTRGDVPLENRGLFLSEHSPHLLMFGRFDGSGCTYRPFAYGYREDCSR